MPPCHVTTLSLLLQTLLRVWDCFLLEGPKVLFRFSLAILKLHEREIVNKTETISVMRHLKACARVTYDVEGLVQVSVALSGQRRPPSSSRPRQTSASRHSCGPRNSKASVFVRSGAVCGVSHATRRRLVVARPWQRVRQGPGNACGKALATCAARPWQHVWQGPGNACSKALATPVARPWQCVWQGPGNACGKALATPVGSP